MKLSLPLRVIDIGVNLTHRAFRHRWRDIVRGAIAAGVDTLILTGTSLEGSRACLTMAQEWLDEEGTPNLYCTIGVHPHDAKTWKENTSEHQESLSTKEAMRELLKHPLAIAVGECGLDYNRNFSSQKDQIHAFQEQVKLAQELDLPLFLHEREAHEDLIKVLDALACTKALPPIVIHCFTGTEEEALTYIEKGFYIGFTGTICKAERGAPLRALIPKLPLDRLMVETDAPFMGFQKGKRKRSDPADCADVARKLGETLGVSFEEVSEATAANSVAFFRLDKPIL